MKNFQQKNKLMDEDKMLDELAQKHTAKFIFKPERKCGVDRAEDFGGKGGNGRRKKRKAKGRLMKRGKEGVPVFDNVKINERQVKQLKHQVSWNIMLRSSKSRRNSQPSTPIEPIATSRFPANFNNYIMAPSFQCVGTKQKLSSVKTQPTTKVCPRAEEYLNCSEMYKEIRSKNYLNADITAELKNINL